MQYFTFLGTGGQNGYQTLLTYFPGAEEDCIATSLVQELIYERFKDEIDEVYVFMTKESKERYLDELKSKLKNVPVHEIMISQNITSEQFIQTLQHYVKSGEPIILDVTHSFRKIPIRLLFALRYIEQVKDIDIRHIFYGEVEGQTEKEQTVSVVHDLENDYKLQKISEYLHQFNQTLTIHPSDWQTILNDDPKIASFLKALTQFDAMVEFCNLPACSDAIRQIVERAKSLEKEPERYAILLPLTQKIREKFEIAYGQKDEKDKLAQVISILLAHRRYQLAVTFTDELFRRELIHAVYDPDARNYKEENVKIRLGFHPRERNFAYTCSQYLQSRILDKPIVEKSAQRYEGFDEKYHASMEKTNQVCQHHRGAIKTFYDCVRNQMNHGNGIGRLSEDQLIDVIAQMVQTIHEL